VNLFQFAQAVAVLVLLNAVFDLCKSWPIWGRVVFMSKPMTPEQHREHAQTHTKKNSWWLHDARGIACARVCDEPGCEEAVRARYKPEVFEPEHYDDAVEEPIEAD
jgi:hypothetical protein